MDVYEKLGLNKDKFVNEVESMLRQTISTDYANRIAETIADDVAEDILETRDGDMHFNGDDIKLAIGRVMCDVLGIVY